MSLSMRFVGLAALLCSTACTQAAAPVDLRGLFGGTSSNSTYNSQDGFRTASTSATTNNYSSYQPAPVYTNTRTVSQATQSSASVQTIGTTDLAPPPKTTAPQTFGVQPAPAAQLQPQSFTAPKPAPVVKAAETQAVNPWTKKPRNGDEEAAISPAAGKPVPVQLTNIEPERPLVTSTTVTRTDGFMWPVSSKKVVSGFGPKGGGKVNDGINIAMAEGEPVWAAADGEVVYVGNELKGYGNMVLIKHTANRTTSYAHLSRASVDKYSRVKQGDIIGYVGTTGNVSKPQLHFTIREGKEAVDPQKYLSNNVAGL